MRLIKNIKKSAKQCKCIHEILTIIVEFFMVKTQTNLKIKISNFVIYNIKTANCFKNLIQLNWSKLSSSFLVKFIFIASLNKYDDN
jgi:hypothetical protein